MKALASDYDGTLNFREVKAHNSDFLPEDLAAIKKFQENGGLFGVCTGRPLDHVTRETDPVGLHLDFYILTTGALLLDGEKNIIAEYPIDYQTGSVIAKHFQNNGLIVQANNNLYFNDAKRAKEEQSLYFEDYSFFKDIKVDGFSLECKSGQEAAQAAKEINQFYPQLHAYQNIDSVDIVDHHASKGLGVKKMKEALGIDLMGGIGDSFNDITMLMDSDMSFTFKRCPQLRRYANMIVDTIADALEMIEEL